MPGVSVSTWLLMVQPWIPVYQPIVRRIGALAEVRPGREVICIGGGDGRIAIWCAERIRAAVDVVDTDSEALARGESVSRRVTERIRPRFQLAPATELPHESAVFDIVLVDLGGLAPADPARVLAEAGRVLRPGGVLVAVAPIWHQLPPPDFRDLLRARLGFTAHLLVEWKRWLREAGLSAIAAEEYAGDGWVTGSRVTATVRGWRLAGMRGARVALSPAATIFWQQAESRSLGLTLLRGVRPSS